MLRIEFDAEALLGTRFAPEPAPLMELGLGMATLQRRDAVLDGWRRDVHPRLGRAAAPLLGLVPASGAGPVFLDPISAGVDDGLDQVLSAPAEVVAAELRRVTGAGKAITPWLRDLDARDGEAWAALGTAVRAGYDAAVGPWWPQVTAAYGAELAMRSRMFALDGVRAVLASLYPGSRWRDGSVLEIPVDSTLRVRAGAGGVTLMPSVLWSGRPLVAPHTDGSLLVVYAAATTLGLVAPRCTEGSLARLLGPTRAAVLTTATGTHTTTDLARLLGVSVATVSEHAKILRAAGLIASTRDGKAVLHTVTPLGAHLVAADV